MNAIIRLIHCICFIVGAVIGGIMVPDSTTNAGLVAVQLSIIVGGIVGTFFGILLGFFYEVWSRNRELDQANVDIPMMLGLAALVTEKERRRRGSGVDEGRSGDE